MLRSRPFFFSRPWQALLRTWLWVLCVFGSAGELSPTTVLVKRAKLTCLVWEHVNATGKKVGFRTRLSSSSLPCLCTCSCVDVLRGRLRNVVCAAIYIWNGVIYLQMSQIFHGVMNDSIRPEVPANCHPVWANMMDACCESECAPTPSHPSHPPAPLPPNSTLAPGDARVSGGACAPRWGAGLSLALQRRSFLRQLHLLLPFLLHWHGR